MRLGMAWAVLTLAAAAAGPVVLAVLLSPVAALAAAQTAFSWRRRPRRPAVAVAAAGAGLVAASSTLGLRAVIVAVLLVTALLVLARAVAPSGRGRPGRAAPELTGLIAVGAGLAAASPVLLRSDGLVPAFVMLSFAHVYDAGAYVVGTGARSPWEGTAAGVASIAAVTLAAAAVLVPPFRGFSPWLLGGLAALVTPLGPAAATAILGDKRRRTPALRRLDSLLVLAPVWTLAAALMLD